MSSSSVAEVESEGRPPAKPQALLQATVMFAGDSGDGMQLAGTQFTNTSAIFGNDISTFPDYPAEIRAPAGTLAGVSGFQIHFGQTHIRTPGDKLDALLAMNPAALKVNLPRLREGGIIVTNTNEYTKALLKKAGFGDQNPLEDESLERYRVYPVPITDMTLEATKETGLTTKDSSRCKNFFGLGVLFWLYDRPLDTTLNWIEKKFAKVPAVAKANIAALRAGYNYAETAEMFPSQYQIQPAKLTDGRYRNLTGNQATAMGLVAAAQLAGKPMFYGSYPITPASDILHDLAAHKHYDVTTFQAEDEIAAMCATIGAAYAGAISSTGTSGPGMALKQEAIGLAVMTELPMVIVNVQRGGPSTGLPTKTEQADLFQAVIGRNGECPLPVLAASSSADCFHAAIEATRISVKYMTPVVLLTDGYLANGAEPFRIPDVASLEKIEVSHPGEGTELMPYARDEHGARPWAIPGTPGLEHRIGGLEKADGTGHVDYTPENHQRMVNLRHEKVMRVAESIPDQDLNGPAEGDLLVISWGGTRGAVESAVEQAQEAGHAVSHMHMRWLNPMPKNVGEILKRFKIACWRASSTWASCRCCCVANYLVDV
jgi:2-oxoglutarate ferredoxin oxidoreductase subunit alpha